MKRIAATLFLMLCSCLFAIAQNSNTLTFLGIPVDGSEQEMIDQLKQKGFKEKIGYDCLTGQFNGETVDVYIHTNHKVVDRIFVAFQPTTIYENLSKYNKLLAQFKNNNKYSDFGVNSEIPMDEVTFYENMLGNRSIYQAQFLFINEPVATRKRLFRFRKKAYFDFVKEHLATGFVWFTFRKNSRGVFIGLCYDNLANRPNGEDL